MVPVPQPDGQKDVEPPPPEPAKGGPPTTHQLVVKLGQELLVEYIVGQFVVCTAHCVAVTVVLQFVLACAHAVIQVPRQTFALGDTTILVYVIVPVGPATTWHQLVQHSHWTGGLFWAHETILPPSRRMASGILMVGVRIFDFSRMVAVADSDGVVWARPGGVRPSLVEGG